MMPSEFSRSADWMLDAISISNGLDLTLSYEPFDGTPFDRTAGAINGRDHDVEHIRYCIHFAHPAAWAFVDLSLMLQYFPYDDCPPVLEEVDRDGDHVYIRQFSIYKEVHGETWRRYRLTIGDDIVEVMSVDRPQVEPITA